MINKKSSIYSYSYRFKASFYATLNIDKDIRKLIKKYNEVKDQALRGATIYFVTKNEKDEI